MNDPELLLDGQPLATMAQPSLAASDVRRSVDDLVDAAHRYRSSREYAELLAFITRFRRYSPFNALLFHVQRPGASYVANAREWRERYGRHVRPGEQPLIALQPFGPVMFVYDVSQTEPADDEELIPVGVAAPFAMPPMVGVEKALERTTELAKRDGVRISEARSGSLSAGRIHPARSGLIQSVLVRKRPPERRHLAVHFELELNASFPATERFTTVAHELGHLYCGHVGTPDPKWWPARVGLPEPVREFEAETVAYLTCQRVDPEVRMPVYLDQYLDSEPEVPHGFSLERVLWAAGQVIGLAEGTAKPRMR